MVDSSEYITVYEANGHLAGEMVRLLLEANEIPTVAVQESAGRAIGLVMGPMGIVQIKVPLNRQVEAQALIREMEEGRLDGIYYPGRYSEKPSYKNNKSYRNTIPKS